MSFDVGDGDEAVESELPALEQLVAMGYSYLTQTNLNKERKDYRQVLLNDRLAQAIRKHNPDLDDDGVHDTLEQIKEDTFPHHLDQVDTNEKIRAKLIGLSQSGGL